MPFGCIAPQDGFDVDLRQDMAIFISKNEAEPFRLGQQPLKVVTKFSAAEPRNAVFQSQQRLFGEQVRSSASARLVLEIEITERLPVPVSDKGIRALLFGPAPWASTLDQTASPTPTRRLAGIFLRAYAALQVMDRGDPINREVRCTMKIFSMALVAIALVALLVPSAFISS